MFKTVKNCHKITVHSIRVQGKILSMGLLLLSFETTLGPLLLVVVVAHMQRLATPEIL